MECLAHDIVKRPLRGVFSLVLVVYALLYLLGNLTALLGKQTVYPLLFALRQLRYGRAVRALALGVYAHTGHHVVAEGVIFLYPSNGRVGYLLRVSMLLVGYGLAEETADGSGHRTHREGIGFLPCPCCSCRAFLSEDGGYLLVIEIVKVLLVVLGSIQSAGGIGFLGLLHAFCRVGETMCTCLGHPAL